MRIPKGGIAFFDSGIGGITVLAECIKRFPNATFYYYGDNRHAPYGNRSPQEIKKLVFRAFKKMERLHVRAAVVACNTATVVCVEELRRRYSFPIIGAEPALLPAAKRGGEVLVLATSATCASARFYSLCQKAQKRFPQSTIRSVACHNLAGAIEKHLLDETFDYTSFLPKAAPNSVVLGCTHYIYIKKIIEDFYQTESFDGNEGISNRLASWIEESVRDTQPPITPSINPPVTTKIFFLGSRKKHNRRIFKQMFAKVKK